LSEPTIGKARSVKTLRAFLLRRGAADRIPDKPLLDGLKNMVCDISTSEWMSWWPGGFPWNAVALFGNFSRKPYLVSLTAVNLVQ
jgi:hypothetical protein